MTKPLFRAWDVFLLRTTVLTADDRPLAASLSPEEGRAAYMEVLSAAADTASLVEGVSIASPSLTGILNDARAHRLDAYKTAKLRRAALATLRYDIRQRTRPTPFGTFAGVTFGHFEISPNVEWGSAHRTHTQPNMAWLLGLVEELEHDTGLLPYLHVQTHDALVTRGGRVRLATPSNTGITSGGERRSNVSVRNTAALAEALAAAQQPTLMCDVAMQLREAFPRVDEATVYRLLAELIDKEILLTELRPPLDGTDQLRHVIDVLVKAGDCAGVEPPELAELRKLEELRDAYDDAAIGNAMDSLRNLATQAEQIHSADKSIHVDTTLDLRVSLPKDVRTEAEQAADALWRMSPPRLGMPTLRHTHDEFVKHYGVDRLVPLLDVLDPTVGLGAPAGYTWPRSERPTDDETSLAGDPHRDEVRLALVTEAIRTGQREVVLGDDLVNKLAHEHDDPRDAQRSSELFFYLAASSLKAITEGDFRLVTAPIPGSHQAGATLGRFAGLDEQAQPQVAELCRTATSPFPGAECVDLVYQPRSSRAGNIANNQDYTRRRISIGVPATDSAEEIRLDDIAVGATLHRLYAVHAPSGTEIVPVAHNMLSPGHQAPNVARLLYEIGQEGHRLWEPWNWGPAALSPFLPRVRYGRTVLCPATWRLDELEDSHATPDTSAEDWSARVHAWRSRWCVPERVFVLSSDQRLLLNLDEPWHRELLRDELRKDPNLVAQEMPDEATPGGWLGDVAGRERLAEIVVPLSRRSDLPGCEPAAARVERSNPPSARRHSPGGEWLYLQLYSSQAGQDELIREYLPALVEAALEAGADRWFFLRYSDPASHIRLRFHGDPACLWTAVLKAVSTVLRRWQDDRLLGRYLIDEYAPEWERYGGPAAQQMVEGVFHADSAAAMQLLALEGKSTRYSASFDLDTLAAISVASLCQAFGPSSPGAAWVDHAEGDPAATWLAGTGENRDLPTRFRQNRESWRRLVDPAAGWPELSDSTHGRRVAEIFGPRDEAVEEYGRVIRKLGEEGRCATEEVRIVGSLMHMTCNRLFGGPTERETAVLGLARGSVLDNLQRRRRGA